MMVTAVIPVDREKSKVFLEEGFAFVLSGVRWNGTGLEEGRELEDEVYQGNPPGCTACKGPRSSRLHFIKGFREKQRTG